MVVYLKIVIIFIKMNTDTQQEEKAGSGGDKENTANAAPA
jgi:hypothetical protein